MGIRGVLTAATAALLAGGALAACTGGHASSSASPTGRPTTTVPILVPLTAPPPAPKASAAEAVSALLRAEQATDHTASFLLLDAAGRAAYPLPTDWARRRTEVPPVKGFRVESTKGDDVVVAVDHDPGIDPFVGLAFAHERQTWHAHKESAGWLVDPDPQVAPVVPPDAGARTAALAWATALQSCDTAAAGKDQAITTLLGVSAGPAALCHAPGPVTADPPVPAPQGPQTADLVAQYTVDVLPYVRQVHISGAPAPFDAYLVPIGDGWQVVAVGG